jgi:hypothetical protein
VLFVGRLLMPQDFPDSPGRREVRSEFRM